MPNYLRRRWSYLMAKLNGDFEERADPKVQLEQAITEAQEQHRRLLEQAANVVANQKQTDMQLNRAMEELEKVGASTRQALRMAQDATDSGDTQKASEYNQTAEAFANRLIATENQVDGLKAMSLQTAQAAQAAKASVQQNSLALQQKLADRQKLLSQLDQAKMQEQLNSAMTSLSQQGDSVPTLDQVRDKIEARYAKALGTSELSGQTTESRMLEVQQAAMNSEARGRLEAMRAELGITTGSPAASLPAPAPASELDAGSPEPASSAAQGSPAGAEAGSGEGEQAPS